MQHLVTFALLLLPGYGAILGITAILASVSKKLLPIAAARVVVVPVAAAVLLFSPITCCEPPPR